MTYNMENDVASVLIDKNQIREICERLGKQISEDYKDSKNLVLVCILKGSTPFFADLMREVTVPCTIEFMRVSSYSGTVSTGAFNVLLDLNIDNISECDLVVVEDIVDSGNTLYKLKKYLEEKGCNSVKICTLLDKPDRRAEHLKGQLKVDYLGAVIPDEFVIGYGLDYDEKYRNLPYVGILKREVYEK